MTDTHTRRRHKRPESVLILVYTQDLEVLLLKRVDHRGFWQSVTGSLRWDETPQAAAVREVAEETGITDTDRLRDCGRSFRFEILVEWRHHYQPGTVENLEHLFSLELAATVPVTLNPKEHSDYQWQPWHQAADTVWSWTNRAAILTLEPVHNSE